ncbi:hypothetical protein NPIL_521241 [Nephila pilipes]|uniref:Uncharacterized protein n=1 Tax=Nephila pilipes TaxID=299642 RepID=A0A8X6TIZ6_NEPPI|nr:hypothetical protein NPIL_521241 [Nephila pilipes]
MANLFFSLSIIRPMELNLDILGEFTTILRLLDKRFQLLRRCDYVLFLTLILISISPSFHNKLIFLQLYQSTWHCLIIFVVNVLLEPSLEA